MGNGFRIKWIVLIFLKKLMYFGKIFILIELKNGQRN